jgi:hypothetical protein
MPPTPTAPAEPDAMSDVDEELVMGDVGMQGGLTFYYFEWLG